MTAADVGAVFAALYAGHQVGDLWVQTHQQANAKGQPGWPGRLACAAHALTLTATLAVALAALDLVTAVRLAPAAAGLTVNAVSHYWADRRTTLIRLHGLTRNASFYHLGSPRPGRDDNPTLGTGAFHLDQAFHIAWLFIATLIITARW